jgi:hypothetical protein
VNAGGHSLGQSNIQCADLRVDVGEEGGAGPPSDLHYQGVIHALQFERHSAGRPKWVGGNALVVIALGGQVGVVGGLVDEGRNIGDSDVEGRRDKAQGGSDGATLGEDAMDSPGKGLDGTKPVQAAGVVNGSPSLPG